MESLENARTKERSALQVAYRKSVVKKLAFMLFCVFVVILTGGYSATIGSYPIAVGDVYAIIWKQFTGWGQVDPQAAYIVLQLRLPRIAGAIVCGFGLAACGAAMQSMMKNPLADPYTMGISSGAGLGAAIAIILGFELFAGAGIVTNAFIFAIIPAMVVLILSQVRRASPTMMILCGISLMYIFSAITSLLMLLATPDDLAAVYTWTIGSLSKVSWENLPIMTVVVILGSVYLQYLANQLNIMSIGDESAKSLGVNVERRRLICLLVITLMAASIVSFTGIIGFVGLVCPHIVRIVMGSDNKFLIPGSAIFGSAMLIVSDLVARTVVSPTMLPVGVITACIGGPLFMYLILKNRKEAW
ncbi:MAG: iron ABC transporter permease [Methanomassiliicoccus sp.]|nr:iron ABC transporter permease [Methanomassiliicoccus sp.]